MEQRGSLREPAGPVEATAPAALLNSHATGDARAVMPSPITASASVRDPSVASDPNVLDFDMAAATDLDLLWENLEFRPEPVDYAVFSSGFPFNPEVLGQHSMSNPPPFHSHIAGGPSASPMRAHPDELNWQDTLSRYASRLPSLQPSQGEDEPPPPPPPLLGAQRDATKDSTRHSLYVSREVYSHIQGLVDAEKHHLPLGFRIPSRHAFSRYMEGFSGYQTHLPFLHIPTTDVIKMPLELIFAVSGAGAQYRFERHEAYALGQAARRIIDVRLGLGDPSNLTGESGGSVSTSIPSADPSPPASNPGSHRACAATSMLGAQRPLDMETLQAMIIVITLYTYNHRDLLPQAFVLADQMAHQLRHGGYLDAESELTTDGGWGEWIQGEGRRRTVLTAFLLLNIHTVIYNVPPRLMNSEVWAVRIPQPEAHWQASTAGRWRELRSCGPPISATFGDCYSDLFVPGPAGSQVRHETSAFGNLLIIHGLLQQIHLAREASIGLDFAFHRHSSPPLPDDVAARFKSALQRWQSSWSRNKESSVRPNSPEGPLGFNSTALFRVACVRVDFNIGPYRRFETRDPAVIAAAFEKAPRPPRSAHLYAAVLQSAHALSIPVRLGIQYVAKTQTLTWSLIHSLCNLECALFLSKWLEQLSLEEPPLMKEEERLVCIIAGILQETSFFEPCSPRTCSSAVIRQMSSAIIKLVVEMSTGVHVYELMDSFEEAIKLYASYLESDREPEA
ncbi:hypothetical protein ACJ41O_008976 [Fusarium nematophilum]